MHPHSSAPEARYQLAPQVYLAWCIFVVWGLPMPSPAVAGLIVSPTSVVLDSPEASQQLIVSLTDEVGRRDVTGDIRMSVGDVSVADIEGRALVRPRSEGRTEIVIQFGNETVRVPVDVIKQRLPDPVSFRNEIIPILTKARCNSGGCHGKAEGQNGFKLSIFGFDAESDYAALMKDGKGRRISLTQPQTSLVLVKGTSQMPHGGGRKIEVDSYRYNRVLRWIREGARLDPVSSETGQIVSIEVEPREQILLANGTQQLRVTAIDRSGTRRCVTVEAEYESNAAAIADVDQRGLVQASDVPGEAAILVRYLGHVTSCRVTLPRSGVMFERPAETNFVDKLVWDQLGRLGIKAGSAASDSEFLRRVYFDTIGTLPTSEEARRYLADASTDKRDQLIEELLNRDEYVDYWTMKWLDILRADQLIVTPQGTVAMQRWLRHCFQQNVPFDQMARELLTVQGSTTAEGPGAFYKILKEPDEMSRAVSQLLLGVRIECAQCHHHPSERWSQGDYTALAGFFTGVKLKKLPNGTEAIVSLGGKDLPHPRTGELVSARALGAAQTDLSGLSDRRVALADWLVRPDNEFFAKAIANRIWAHYLGRGLVEPVDDIRETNPATNEPLMKALSQHMIGVKFDMKSFTRTLLRSRVYQLSSESNDSNRDDLQNFSHATYKALPAEVLLDAISQSTGVAEKFNGWPDGYRAIQIWDNRMPSYFFQIFGRPVRATVCECERSGEPSISQALHLLNSPEITAKIRHREGMARRLAKSELTVDELIDELYLTALSRFPRDEERALMADAFAVPEISRQEAVEDVLWALLNMKEFIFNH
ncbi:MAG: DUF1553 domain-containing protein [Planctomycetota bacterium]|nr:DUF1553 domain-containing protein [Planctomycetota bacterium]